jgi:hypothetical protein
MVSKKTARLVLILIVVIALASLLGRALLEVSRGNGAGVYENNYGMSIHWITVLSFATALLVAFIVAVGLRWWQSRDDRLIQSALTETSMNKNENLKGQ